MYIQWMLIKCIALGRLTNLCICETFACTTGVKLCKCTVTTYIPNIYISLFSIVMSFQRVYIKEFVEKLAVLKPYG